MYHPFLLFLFYIAVYILRRFDRMAKYNVHQNLSVNIGFFSQKYFTTYITFFSAVFVNLYRASKFHLRRTPHRHHQKIRCRSYRPSRKTFRYH